MNEVGKTLNAKVDTHVEDVTIEELDENGKLSTKSVCKANKVKQRTKYFGPSGGIRYNLDMDRMDSKNQCCEEGNQPSPLFVAMILQSVPSHRKGEGCYDSMKYPIDEMEVIR